MKPTNNKSLLHFIFDQMDKLDKKEITNDEARTQALLAKQANNVFKYENDRAKIQMELAIHNAKFKDGLNLRPIEAHEVE